jgi:hypothetical protein
MRARRAAHQRRLRGGRREHAVKQWFTRSEWQALPLKLRQQWWRETDYGKLPPSSQLIAAIAQLLKLNHSG